MSDKDFFDKPTEQSRIKASIVAKYFLAWANVMKKQKNVTKIAYIDILSGPGLYQDGTKSTPILVLEGALKKEGIRNKLVTFFNDSNTQYIEFLKNAINGIPDIENLTYPPSFFNKEVTANIIVDSFADMHCPTLYFIDPYGYKEISLRRINLLLKGKGSECIFFFNYNRINMGLSNDRVAKYMNALFGKQRAEELRIKLSTLIPSKREKIILDEMIQALKDGTGNYVGTFRFLYKDKKSTSHYLIFVTKNEIGYKIMKDIMAKESSCFEYNPNTQQQASLFLPHNDLPQLLLKKFTGCTMTVKEIHDQHHVNTPYILKNYKDTLKLLESENKITIDPPASQRRKIKSEVTLADDVKVTFKV